jgi:hypothetical protein
MYAGLRQNMRAQCSSEPRPYVAAAVGPNFFIAKSCKILHNLSWRIWSRELSVNSKPFSTRRDVRKVCESLCGCHLTLCITFCVSYTHFIVEWDWLSFAFYLCSVPKQSSWCFPGSISPVPSLLCVTYRMASAPRWLWISNNRGYLKLGVCHLIRIRYPRENVGYFTSFYVCYFLFVRKQFHTLP